MAFQSVPDCAQATVIQTLNDSLINTTLGFHFDTGQYVQSDINALAVAIDAWFGTEVLALLSSGLVYQQTDVRGLENIADLEASINTTQGIGADTNDPLPALTAACISFRTGFSGRSSRGRNYIAGLSTANMDTNENLIVQSTVDALVAAYEEIPTYLGASGWEHVVISRFSLGVPRVTGTFLPVTTYLFTDRRWDTQRRRK